jgi:hypothetical protein
MTEGNKKKKSSDVLYEQRSEHRIYQTLTLVAVSSFGESLRWVSHHLSGGSHLTANSKPYIIGRMMVNVVPRGDESSQMRP